MHNLVIKSVSCIACLVFIVVAPRRSSHVINDLRGAIRRTLQDGDGYNYIWWIYDQTRVCNTEWVDHYDDEIPRNTDDGGDEVDILYSHNVCYKGGIYSHDNCLEPPDCALQSANAQWDLKLCLNRMPIPDDDDDTYYVKIMKCIPVWENCDKCMCGQIDSSDPTRCKTKDNFYPDDDRLNFSCDEGAILRFASYLITPYGFCEAMPNDKEKEHTPEKLTPVLDFSIAASVEVAEAPAEDAAGDHKSDATEEDQTEDEETDEQDEDQTKDEESDEQDEAETEDGESDEQDEDQTEDEESDERDEDQTEDEGDEQDEDQIEDEESDEQDEDQAEDGEPDEPDEDQREKKKTDDTNEDQNEDKKSNETDEDQIGNKKSDENDENQTDGETSDEADGESEEGETVNDETQGVAADSGKNQEDTSDNE